MRSIIDLTTVSRGDLNALIGWVETVELGTVPRLASSGAVLLLCAVDAPLARLVVEAAVALLGLSVRVVGPSEVAALGDLVFAGERLGALHIALIGVGLPAGGLAALASRCPVPVLNGGDGGGDPIGALADLRLMASRWGSLAGRRLTWIGDGSGLLNDLLVAAPGVGLSVAIAHPIGFAPDAERLTIARERAAESGVAVMVTLDPAEALVDASVVYVTPWPEGEAERFKTFAIQRHSLWGSRTDALVLHTAPERRAGELSASFDEDVRANAVRQVRGRVDAAVAWIGWLLRLDPLHAVLRVS